MGNLNSIPLDYVVRQKVSGGNLNFFIVKQLPILSPDLYSKTLLNEIVPKVVELVYTSWDLIHFSDEIWKDTEENLRVSILQQWDKNANSTNGGHYKTTRPDWTASIISNGFPRPPFKWDEERRAHLRAELDGLYAHLYGLHRDELAYILDTFPVVRRKDEARYGEFRTKRLVLEAYDRLVGNEMIPPEARARAQESVLAKASQPAVVPTAKPARKATGSLAQPSARKTGPLGERAGSETRAAPESFNPVKPVDENPAAEMPAAGLLVKEQAAAAPPPAPTDYGLYRCQGCGKRVLGYDKVEHTRQVHGGKDPGYGKIG